MATLLTRPDAAESESLPERRRVAVRTWHVALALTFAVGAFTLLFRLGESRSLGSHEAYTIVPAREMLRTGDYVVPRFGGLPRLQKPPLIYWTILASAKLTGGLDFESARLPIALSGLLLAGVMAAWAYKWYGGPAAVGAAAAQFTSAYVLVFARKAEADILLVLLIAAALYLIANHEPGESRRTSFLRWLGVWACAALSWLGKFHFGPAMIFTPAVAWLILERRWRFLFGLFNPAGILLCAVAAGIWPVLVLNRLPEAWSVWQAETLGRAVGELGRQPLWFYLPHLAIWTLPWTLFAVLAWPASCRDALGPAFARLRQTSGERGGLVTQCDRFWRNLIETGSSGERFLWIWLAVTFAIVTASANKHPHYIMPALPAFSLWTGRRFSQLAEQARSGKRLLPWPAATALTATGIAAFVAPMALRDRLPEEIPLGTLLLVVGPATTGLVATAWLLVSRRIAAAGAVAAVAWVFAFAVMTGWLIPGQDHRSGAYRFVQDLRQRLGEQAPIGVYHMDQDAVVWYLGEPVFRAEVPEQVAGRLADGAPLRILTIAGYEPELARVGDVKVVERFADPPGYAPVRAEQYRQMVLVELAPGPQTAGTGTPARR